MISSAATVFAEHPELTVPRITRRFQHRYDALRLPDGRLVLRMPGVGSVVMSAWDTVIRLQFLAVDAAADFAARAALETILRRSLRGVLFTIAWEDVGSIALPQR
jgi:hypothetical protein